MKGYACLLTIALLTGAIAAAAPADAASGARLHATPLQQAEEPVDINTATAEQLEKVPGIGPATAARIIEWRETQGRFERLEDLLNVRGIGTKTLEKLRPYLKVGEESSGGAA